jgi:hypothetical protein
MSGALGPAPGTGFGAGFRESGDDGRSVSGKFGAAFDGLGFTATEAFRQVVIGDFMEEILKEVVAHRMVSSLEESFAKPADARQGSGKTQAAQGLEATLGTLKHDAANEIVHEDMLTEFPVDRVGILATELVHLEGDLEITKTQLNGPATKEEFGKGTRRISNGIQKGCDEHDFRGAEGGLIDATA